jgi:CspA family cold shock protein
VSKITGTIKKFTDRGFGFIRPDDYDGKDIFIHHTVVEAAGIRALAAGDRVEFEITASDRGPRASTVRLVD